MAGTRAQDTAQSLALLALCCAVSLFATAASTSADNEPHVMGAGAAPDTCALCRPTPPRPPNC